MTMNTVYLDSFGGEPQTRAFIPSFIIYSIARVTLSLSGAHYFDIEFFDWYVPCFVRFVSIVHFIECSLYVDNVLQFMSLGYLATELS